MPAIVRALPGAIALIGAASLWLGCGGAERAGPAASRDSAGIEIVTSAAPSWPDGRGWTVADTPSVDISGGGTQETDVSQVSGGVRLADGRIAVASTLSNAVRYYDGKGKLIASSGRPGSGPGEFQGLTGLWRGPADSILAGDMMLMRMTMLGPTGGFVRTFTLGGQGGITPPANGQFGLAIPVGRMADGSVVGMRVSFNLQQQTQGNYRDSMVVLRYAPDGLVRDTVAKVLGVEMTQVSMTFDGQTMATPSPVPLGRQTVIGVGDDRLYFAQNIRWEVEVRSPGGSLERLIRLDSPDRPIGEAEIAAHKQEQIDLLESLPQMRGVPQQMKDQFFARVNEAKYPATLPWIAGLFPVSDGNLWVEEVIRPGEERRQFAVFDRAGTFLGRVAMPPRFRVLNVYPDAVLGVWKDADDVEHIRLHPIVR